VIAALTRWGMIINHRRLLWTISPADNTLHIMAIIIYHNPNCGTSRNVLTIIRESGIEPRVIEYLKTPPTRAELVDIIKRMNTPVRDLLRQKGTPYDDLGLADAKWSDDELIDFIIQHPILMNRPVVVTELGAKLCRPPEIVKDILPG
jgi:arsenate reductase